MKSTPIAAGALAAVLALAAAPAGASPGNGIRLGGSEGRLHPYLDVEGRWDSNVLFSSTGAAIGDLILHFRPGFTVSVPGEAVAVDFDGKLDWAQYLGVDSTATRDLSRLFGEATLGITVNRRGQVGLELDDRFARSASTQAFVFDGAVISNLNVLSVKVPWKPGGGALVLTLSGDWTLETFEPFGDCPAGSTSITCDPTALGDRSYNDLRGSAEVRWRFLPRTSALAQVSYFSRQPTKSSVQGDASGFDGRVGLTGLVTPHLGASVKLGYADTTTSTNQGVSTWLATIEAEWLATEAAKLRLGWNHQYGVDPGNVLALYTANVVVLGARYDLAGRYGARLDAYWERRDYPHAAPSSPGAAPGASGDIYRIEPGFEAALTRWLNGSVAYAYSSRSSSSSAAPSGFDYSKNEVWIRLVATY